MGPRGHLRLLNWQRALQLHPLRLDKRACCWLCPRNAGLSALSLLLHTIAAVPFIYTLLILHLRLQPGDTDSDEYKELVQQAKAAKLIPKRGYENRTGWMDRDAYEWTYCSHTGKEKPPRAHYDHITEKLVLNMDHYWCACSTYRQQLCRRPDVHVHVCCSPWMFNVVGYRNYHYVRSPACPSVTVNECAAF